MTSGVPILTNVASGCRMLVEIAWVWDPATDSSGWTWTDVTTDVWQPGNVTITIGRANEASVAQPANCSLRLKNPTGAYTPTNPVSVNYPHVVLGVPLRVSVSIDGGSVWRVRFFGYVSSWAPGWDAQGRFAYVAVTASGVTRRLGSGSKPLKSALYRAITKSPTQPVAYWPFEDGPRSTQANSPIAGVQPATFAYTEVIGSPHFGQATGPPGSDSLPDFSQQADFKATVPDVGTATTWRVQCVAKSDPLPTSSDYVEPLQWFTNNGITFNGVFFAQPGGILNGLAFQDSNGNTFESGIGYDDSAWHEVRAVQTQSGGNIVLNVYVDGVSVISQTYAGTLSNVTGLNGSQSTLDNASGYACGHFVIYNLDFSAGTLDTVAAMNGNAGETADDRLYRLCVTEENIPLNRTGSSDTAMGAQGVDTLLNLLRECETADDGMLFDGPQQDLNYVSRSSLYNQSAALTLDANSGQVPANPGPLPVFDDQRILNRITVTRTNGTSVTDEDEDGPLGTAVIGVHDGRVAVNVEFDAQLTDIAAWRVHQGTAEGMRYPQVLFNLAAAPELASAWVVTTIGERLDLTNLSNRLTQHPAGTVSLLIEGWTEVLSSRLWQATVNTSQYRTWEVFEIAAASGDTGEFVGHLDTDDSALNAGITNSASSFAVKTNSGPLWTTTSDDFPFDVLIDAERITVTNITGSSSPQTFTVTRSVNGVTASHLANAAVSLYQPLPLAL